MYVRYRGEKKTCGHREHGDRFCMLYRKNYAEDCTCLNGYQLCGPAEKTQAGKFVIYNDGQKYFCDCVDGKWTCGGRFRKVMDRLVCGVDGVGSRPTIDLGDIVVSENGSCGFCGFNGVVVKFGESDRCVNFKIGTGEVVFPIKKSKYMWYQ